MPLDSPMGQVVNLRPIANRQQVNNLPHKT